MATETPESANPKLLTSWPRIGQGALCKETKWKHTEPSWMLPSRKHMANHNGGWFSFSVFLCFLCFIFSEQPMLPPISIDLAQNHPGLTTWQALFVLLHKEFASSPAPSPLGQGRLWLWNIVSPPSSPQDNEWGKAQCSVSVEFELTANGLLKPCFFHKMLMSLFPLLQVHSWVLLVCTAKALMSFPPRIGFLCNSAPSETVNSLVLREYFSSIATFLTTVWNW